MEVEKIAIGICAGDTQAEAELEKMMGKPLGEMSDAEKKIGLACLSAFESEWRKGKRGTWTINTDDFTPAYRCSACGYNKPMIAGVGANQGPMNYCPNCGAKMDI